MAQAAPWVPQIDNAKVNQAKYARDYAECKAFADGDPTTNVASETKRAAAKYGLGGLALGGAIMVASGGLAAPLILPAMAGTVAVAGGAGAVGGAVNAHEAATAKYRNMVATCLQGRGYTVLN